MMAQTMEWCKSCRYGDPSQDIASVSPCYVCLGPVIDGVTQKPTHWKVRIAMPNLCASCSHRSINGEGVYVYSAHKDVCTSCTSGSNYKMLEFTSKSSQIFTYHEWETLLTTSIEKIKELAKLKGGEYAGDVDRLANFREGAQELGVSLETVWAIYALKHWKALQRYIKDQNEEISRDRLEPIEGRVDDLLVYLLLFKAILREKSR